EERELRSPLEAELDSRRRIELFQELKHTERDSRSGRNRLVVQRLRTLEKFFMVIAREEIARTSRILKACDHDSHPRASIVLQRTNALRPQRFRMPRKIKRRARHERIIIEVTRALRPAGLDRRSESRLSGSPPERTDLLHLIV